MLLPITENQQPTIRLDTAIKLREEGVKLFSQQSRHHAYDWIAVSNLIVSHNYKNIPIKK